MTYYITRPRMLQKQTESNRPDLRKPMHCIAYQINYSVQNSSKQKLIDPNKVRAVYS